LFLFFGIFVNRIFYSIIFLISYLTTIFSAKSENLINFEITALDNPAPGYILTGPVNKQVLTAYDNSGNVAFSKSLDAYGNTFYSLRLLSNGNLTFYSNSKKIWFVVDKNLNILDSVKATEPYKTDFHTIQMSPNGNYLVVADESKIINMQEKVQNGRTNATVTNQILQELDANRNVVFQWNCWEHLDIMDVTPDIDLKGAQIDPFHINSAKYDTDGNILLSVRNFDELIKVSRSSGQILWILGGSKSKRNQFTFTNDTLDGFNGFSHQHDISRLTNGNILMFDNGNLKPNKYSRAVEYQIDETNKTVTRVWEYRAIPDVYGAVMGNAQRLPNGNTMIGWGASFGKKANLIATEVTPEGNIAFEMRCPNDGFYQVLRSVFKMESVLLNVNKTYIYDFNDAKNKTGINLDINNLTGRGPTSVELHSYRPYNMDNSINVCNYLPYRWNVSNHGISTFTGKISLDLSILPGLSNKPDIKFFWRPKENTGDFQMIETIYDAPTDKISANINSFGEFILAYNYFFKPVLNYPANDTMQTKVNTVLSWNRTSPNEKYHIQISESNNFNFTIVDTSGITLNQFSSVNLKNLTKYYWRVKAEANVCESEWSEIRSFTTIIGSPAPMLPMNNSHTEDIHGTLKWGSVTGAETYKIQISEDSLFSKITLDKNLNNLTSFKYDSLKFKQKYFWRIASSNKGVFGDWSDIWTFSTYIGKMYQTYPKNRVSNVLSHEYLKWQLLDGAKLYHIQVSNDTSFLINRIDTIGISSDSLAFKWLHHTTKYYWRVKGYDEGFESEWSDVWEFKTVISTPKLQIPGNNELNTSIKGYFHWNAIKEAVSYQVQLSIDSTFDNMVFNLPSQTDLLPYSKLKFSSSYYWRVRAYNGQYPGEWSEVFKFITQPEDYLVHPELTYPRQNDYKVSINPVINWDESAGAIFYEVSVADDSLFTINNHLYQKITETTLPLTGLDYNKSYFIKLRAINNKMESLWSEYSRFTTSLRVPEFTSKIIDTVFQNDKILFSWNVVDSAIFYKIQTSETEDFAALIDNIEEISATELDYKPYKSSNTIYWRVAAYNSVNESDWSKIGLIIIKSTSGVLDNGSLSQLSVNPQPLISNGKITFKLDEPSSVKLEVLDNLGNVIQTIENKFLSTGEYYYNISVESLPSGVYYCKFSDGKKFFIKDFLIIK